MHRLPHPALDGEWRGLTVLLHHLWITGEAYEPLYQAKKEKMASSR
jgi:hypothetical protein